MYRLAFAILFSNNFGFAKQALLISVTPVFCYG